MSERKNNLFLLLRDRFDPSLYSIRSFSEDINKLVEEGVRLGRQYVVITRSGVVVHIDGTATPDPDMLEQYKDDPMFMEAPAYEGRPGAPYTLFKAISPDYFIPYRASSDYRNFSKEIAMIRQGVGFGFYITNKYGERLKSNHRQKLEI